METFNVIAGVASFIGLFFSATAAVQARRASKAAIAARNAAIVRTLADELQLASTRAEQLVDFLAHGRFGEAALRSDELTYSLSELPFRRSGYLQEPQVNALLTSRQQLQSISEIMSQTSPGSLATYDTVQSEAVARRVVISLREVLGQVRSGIEAEV
jgi:hypothetical protein